MTDQYLGAPRAALEEQRDTLLASLRDLEKERARGEIIETDYRELHDAYTARAAAVLRALDARPVLRMGTANPRRRAGPPGGRRSMLLTMAVVLGVIGLAVGSVLVFAGERDGGQPLSGSLPGSAEDAAPNDPLTQALEFERQGRGVDALKLYDGILRDDPDNAAALAYRGWLLKRAGLIDEALVALDRAVTVAPDFADAHFFRGKVLLEDRNDPAGAVAEFEEFLRRDPAPEMVPAVVKVLERARSAAAQEASPAPAP